MKIESQSILNSAQNIIKVQQSLKNSITQKNENSTHDDQLIITKFTQYKQKLFDHESSLTQKQMVMEGISHLIEKTREESFLANFNDADFHKSWTDLATIADEWDKGETASLKTLLKKTMDQNQSILPDTVHQLRNALQDEFDKMEEELNTIKDDIQRIQISSENWQAAAIITDKSIHQMINDISNNRENLDQFIHPLGSDKIKNLLE